MPAPHPDGALPVGHADPPPRPATPWGAVAMFVVPVVGCMAAWLAYGDGFTLSGGALQAFLIVGGGACATIGWVWALQASPTVGRWIGVLRRARNGMWGQPLGDWAWSTTGERCGPLRCIARRFETTAVWWVAVVAWIGVYAFKWLTATAGMAWPASLMLCSAPFVAIVATLTFCAWGLGTTEVVFPAFPLPTSSPLVVRFAVHEDSATFHSIEATLECGIGCVWRTRIARAIHEVTFRRRQELAHDAGVAGPGDAIELSFALPPDAPSSRVWARRATLYVLHIRGATSAGLYDQSFLLPVYAAAPPAP